MGLGRAYRTRACSATQVLCHAAPRLLAKVSVYCFRELHNSPRRCLCLCCVVTAPAPHALPHNHSPGTFIVYFMGSVSRAINIHSTAAQVKAILEDVQTIGVVNVVRSETNQSTVAPLSRHGVVFAVTFVTNAGDVPSMLVCGGLR